MQNNFLSKLAFFLRKNYHLKNEEKNTKSLLIHGELEIKTIIKNLLIYKFNINPNCIQEMTQKINTLLSELQNNSLNGRMLYLVDLDYLYKSSLPNLSKNKFLDNICVIYLCKNPYNFKTNSHEIKKNFDLIEFPKDANSLKNLMINDNKHNEKCYVCGKITKPIIISYTGNYCSICLKDISNLKDEKDDQNKKLFEDLTYVKNKKISQELLQKIRLYEESIFFNSLSNLNYNNHFYYCNDIDDIALLTHNMSNVQLLKSTVFDNLIDVDAIRILEFKAGNHIQLPNFYKFKLNHGTELISSKKNQDIKNFMKQFNCDPLSLEDLNYLKGNQIDLKFKKLPSEKKNSISFPVKNQKPSEDKTNINKKRKQPCCKACGLPMKGHITCINKKQKNF